MHLLITGGGTAGHVYPALSVVEALKEQQPDSASGELALTWVGASTGLEEDIVRRSGIPFRGIGLRGGVRGVGLPAALRSVVGLALGFLQALRLVRSLRPHVILATGGYVSLPCVLVGWLLRVPSLIYLPDMQPGWAVRVLSPFARRIAVTTEASAAFFPVRKVVVSGYPVRRAFFEQDKKAAREVFGLDPELPTILVVGGSRGAHSINVVIAGALMALLPTFQVIHVTGQRDAAAMRAVRDQLPAEMKARYRPYGFLHEDMVKAMRAADLVIGRAGASVLGEIPAAGVAAILVPYAGGHRDQERNAAFLESQGAAVVVRDADLTPELVEETVNRVAEQQRLATMQKAAAALAKPEAAAVIAAEIRELAARRQAT